MLLMGVDCGSTAIKAAIFDARGATLAVSSRPVQPMNPAPGRVEQDMEALWRSAAQAMREAMDASSAAAGDIACVGVTGHGDGLYLADRGGAPLGAGIMSVDSRGFEIVAEWRAAGLMQPAEALTAQRPYPYAATTLLAWIKRHEPERYRAIGHVMFCKDWIRRCLTGVFATDPTDASTAFTNPHTVRYDPEILRLFDIGEIAPALPPIHAFAETIGVVHAGAAAACGLRVGTPVSGGLHDVTASAVGLGVMAPGALAVTAGTFSINETLSSSLVVDPRWASRAGLEANQWMNMSISPASSNNVDWWLREAYRSEAGAATRNKISVWSFVDQDLAPDVAEHDPLFLPFLYGSPYDEPASGGFLDLRSWHDRGHMLRAVVEGAVFNHVTHARSLASAFSFDVAAISGGGTASPRLAQLFADALALPVEIPEAREVGALGAAMAAGVGVGVFASLDDAAKHTCRTAARFEPRPERSEKLRARFARYTDAVEALRPLWASSRTPDER